MQKVRQCKNNTAQNNTGDECSSFSKGDQASHFTISLFKYLKRHAKADSPFGLFPCHRAASFHTTESGKVRIAFSAASAYVIEQRNHRGLRRFNIGYAQP
jgi:hypothetical protein